MAPITRGGKAQEEAVAGGSNTQETKVTTPNPFTPITHASLENIRTPTTAEIRRHSSVRRINLRSQIKRQNLCIGTMQANFDRTLEAMQANTNKAIEAGQANMYRILEAMQAQLTTVTEKSEGQGCCQECRHKINPAQEPPQAPRIYSGRITDDPELFCSRLKAHLKGKRFEVPADIDDAVLPHLAGEAAEWCRKNEGAFESLDDFTRRLKRKFMGPKYKEALQRACDVLQKETEDPTPFAKRLRQLCLRKDPNMSEISLVAHISSRLTSIYRIQIEQAAPQTMDELVALCEKWYDIFSEMNMTTTKPKEKKQPDQAKSNETPPRCWFCPERHFNRECPYRPEAYNARHPPSQKESGEASGVVPRT